MRVSRELYLPMLSDVPRVAGVLARAMGSDPLNACIFPDARTRAGSLDAMYAMIARVGVRSRMVQATSEQIEGVAMWDLPGEAGFSARAMLRSGPLRFVRRAGLRRAMRLGRYEAWAHGLFVRHVPPHSAHLVLLAVDPAHQGRGWASRLLRAVLCGLDGAGTACGLETQNPANVGFYEHMGFAVALGTRVPGTDVGHWVMVRAAQSVRGDGG